MRFRACLALSRSSLPLYQLLKWKSTVGSLRAHFLASKCFARCISCSIVQKDQERSLNEDIWHETLLNDALLDEKNATNEIAKTPAKAKKLAKKPAKSERKKKKKRSVRSADEGAAVSFGDIASLIKAENKAVMDAKNSAKTGLLKGPIESCIRNHDTSKENVMELKDFNPLLREQLEKSLRKRLGGTSITKSGLENVDFDKVNRIIYDASRGSKYFQHEMQKDRELQARIQWTLQKVGELDSSECEKLEAQVDLELAQRDALRDLSQIIVHCDCDMFFAAVEILEHPELKDKPFGVGSSILCTANYVARQHGVRSAMPTYIARQLCPKLTVIPLHFEKYMVKAREVREVICEYDPKFKAASVDEAYLNITKYLENTNMTAAEAVAEMRAKIAKQTNITVSCGIGPNMRIAKICSDKNKPNGQFEIPNRREDIMAFMNILPIRKVSGVGKVTEALLDALDIKTCGDIFRQRAKLAKVASEKMLGFLIDVYLGLGYTDISQYMSGHRKSIGNERTFSKISDPDTLRSMLKTLAEGLEHDCDRAGGVTGRTLVLKYKLDTYELFTRQRQLPHPVRSAEELYKFALPMLEKQLPLTLRLMGLRLRDLVYPGSSKSILESFAAAQGKSKKETLRTEQMSMPSELSDSDSGPDNKHSDDIHEEALDVFEDETEASSNLDGDMSHASISSGSRSQQSSGKRDKLKREGKNKNSGSEIISSWQCPVCCREIEPNEKKLNAHIDFCLSRECIREMVQTTADDRVLYDRTGENRLPNGAVAELPRVKAGKGQKKIKENVTTKGNVGVKRGRSSSMENPLITPFLDGKALDPKGETEANLDMWIHKIQDRI